MQPMKARNYLIFLGILTVITIVSILFIPGLSDAIESNMLVWLMDNARA